MAFPRLTAPASRRWCASRFSSPEKAACCAWSAAPAASATPSPSPASSKPSPRSNPNPPPSRTSRRHTHSPHHVFLLVVGIKLRRESYSEELAALFQFCRSEEHTSELQSRQYLVCRLLLETKKR